jgi:beta-aspartyl-peptidase (threonine type)
MSWKLVIHGGSGAMLPGRLSVEMDELGRAGSTRAGCRRVDLAAGGRARRVEAAARVLGDDPCFNAGAAAYWPMTGHVELDAAIMDGRNRDAGAVAGLRSTRAPVSAHGP